MMWLGGQVFRAAAGVPPGYRIVTNLIRFLALLGIAVTAQAHDFITTNITWTREISRIFYARCASCHRDGGSAFPLTTYEQVRPWAVAIKEEILERRMPPWGAVKGFGDFRNDEALTAEQIELIVSWIQGGVPEGEPKDLPPVPEFPGTPKSIAREILAGSGYKLTRPLRLAGLQPRTLPDRLSFQITAALPEGTVVPLLWLYEYKQQYGHPFLFRTPLTLPAGTVIHGIPPGARIALLPANGALSPARQTAPYSPPRSAEIAPKSGTSAPAEKPD